MDLATREDVVRVVHLRPKPIGKVIRVIYDIGQDQDDCPCIRSPRSRRRPQEQHQRSWRRLDDGARSERTQVEHLFEGVYELMKYIPMSIW
jgi:hypothetical protein